LSGNAVSKIDFFKFSFPESDPDSAVAYERLMSPLFDFAIPEWAGDKPFYARTESYCLPDATVNRVSTSASRLTRTVGTIARTATDGILVVCYTSGHFTFRIGSMERRVEAGEIAFFDLSQTMVIEAPFVENISLAISRRRLEAVVPLLDSVHGAVMPSTALAKVLIGAMEGVAAAGETMQPAEAGPVADALILMVAAGLDQVSQTKAAPGGAAGAVSLASLKAAIERRLTDPAFGPQALQDEFGMTRSTLYRAFEPLGGVGAYISERRLRHAYRLMTDPAQKELRLSQLAFELGFAHASAFSRAFKTRFGLTPKEARTLAVRPEGKDAPYPVSPDALPYISEA
jgi:AraC-like DNA-binding protein